MSLGIGSEELRRLAIARRVLLVYHSIGWIIFVGLVTSAPCQTTNARMVGTVTDPSGAAMPNILVTVRNLDTNAKRSAQTTDVGYYVLPELSIGNYEISTEAAGFKKHVQGPLKLLVDQTLRVDIRLELGEMTEQVNVTGQAAAIATDQSTIGEVMQNRTIVQLPLDGRHMLQIAQLAPGATQGQYEAVNRFRNYGAVMTSNGGRPEQNNYMIDGTDNASYVLGMSMVVPSVDAIEEFKVQTANFSADMGQASGAVINVAIKSGTNKFHGTVYEFFRNDKLDAKNFFAPTKLPLRQNQFGGSIGGPVIKDKAFFFFNYEGLRSTVSQPYYYWVPTAAMKAGDFSGTWAGRQLPTLYDPLTLDANGNRVPFAGNRIPSNRIHSAATKLLPAIPDPDPQGPYGGGNIQRNYADRINRSQVNIRGDYRLTAKDQIMARYSWWNNELLQQYLNFEGSNWFHKPRNAMVGWTHTYSANILQEVRAAYSAYYEVVQAPFGVGRDYPTELGFQSYPVNGEVYFPYISVSNMGLGFAANGPSVRIERHYQGQYRLTILHGRHTVKVGADMLRFRDKDGFIISMGQYNFGGIFTAPICQTYPNGFADFLLGFPSSQVIQYPIDWDYNRLRNTRVQSYVQDDVNVTRNLTLNLGLRWDWYGPWKDEANRIQYFDYSVPGGQIVYPSVLKLSYALPFPHRFDSNYSALQNARNKQFAPRVGIAWRPFGSDRTVIRSAYGIFWSNMSGYLLSAAGRNGAGLALLDQGTSSNTTPQLTWGKFTGGGSPGNLIPLRPTTFEIDPGSPNPYVQQWNLGIERQFQRDLVLKASYVGSRTTHLDRRYRPNVPLTPGAGDVNVWRRFPLFSTITHQETSAFSTYHALQATLERRLTQGLTFTSNYTWSKCIDDNSGWSAQLVSPNNPFDIAAEKGRCEQDVRHRLTTSYVYQLPVHMNHAVGRHLLGGWETSGVLTLQTGFPFTVLATGDPTNGTAGSARAQYIGGDITLPPSQRTPDRWLNTAAFAQPSPYTFGNSGRNILDGPGYANLNISLMKLFSIREGQQLQFRAEFLNAFNHPYFYYPTGGVLAANFGTISRTAGDNRHIQFGLKYIF